mgnify:CR=1 FL=1
MAYHQILNHKCLVFENIVPVVFLHTHSSDARKEIGDAGVANRKINKSRQCVGSINEDSFIVPRGCCFQELSQRNLASDYVLVILMRIFFFLGSERV